MDDWGFIRHIFWGNIDNPQHRWAFLGFMFIVYRQTGNRENLSIDQNRTTPPLVVVLRNSPVNNDGDETRTFIGLSGISNFHHEPCLRVSVCHLFISSANDRHYWLTKFSFWAIITTSHLRKSFGIFRGLAFPINRPFTLISMTLRRTNGTIYLLHGTITITLDEWMEVVEKDFGCWFVSDNYSQID